LGTVNRLSRLLDHLEDKILQLSREKLPVPKGYQILSVDDLP
jgi:hypothetical protein